MVRNGSPTEPTSVVVVIFVVVVAADEFARLPHTAVASYSVKGGLLYGPRNVRWFAHSFASANLTSLINLCARRG